MCIAVMHNSSSPLRVLSCYRVPGSEASREFVRSKLYVCEVSSINRDVKLCEQKPFTPPCVNRSFRARPPKTPTSSSTTAVCNLVPVHHASHHQRQLPCTGQKALPSFLTPPSSRLT